MKVGSMVLQDFPEHRHDWREDWPDNFPGIILEENEFSTYTVMAEPGLKKSILNIS